MTEVTDDAREVEIEPGEMTSLAIDEVALDANLTKMH